MPRKKIPENVVFFTSNMFLQDGGKMKKEMIAREVNKEFNLADDEKLTRNDVYHCVREAMGRYIKVEAPISERLAFELSQRFELENVVVRVVDVVPENWDYIAQHAAELIKEKIVSMRTLKPRPIGLGIGAGSATLNVCRHLGKLLETSDKPISLRIFGISSGCSATQPEYSPVSFFNLFPNHVVHSRVTLLSEPLISAARFENMKLNLGLKEAFCARNEIDIVVTSMGDFEDPHDGFKRLLEASRPDYVPPTGQVGNVQYRPYSDTGPVLESGDELRVATLFEIDDLTKLATTTNKFVILIVRPCSICQKTKAKALLPLLKVRGLRAFNHIIIDSKTCRELLDLPD